MTLKTVLALAFLGVAPLSWAATPFEVKTEGSHIVARDTGGRKLWHFDIEEDTPVTFTRRGRLTELSPGKFSTSAAACRRSGIPPPLRSPQENHRMQPNS